MRPACANDRLAGVQRLLRAALLSLLIVSCATTAAQIPAPATPAGTATLVAATAIAAATGTQTPATGCGLLVAYAGDGDPKFLLTLRSGGTNTQYRLSGTGTAPADMGDLFVAKTPQLLSITGRLVTPNSAAPQAINLMDFTVARVASCASSSTSPVFAATECTNATATTRQVIERYLTLSTSNNAQAVIDCFAKVWREKNATGFNVNNFTDFAAAWSKAGAVTKVTITFIDTVNGCDRFGVGAQLADPFPNPSAFVYQVPPFFTVGPETGRMRIFETGTGLVNAQVATTTCK